MGLTNDQLARITEFDEDGNIVTGIEAIKMRIKFRVKIMKGEVPFNADWGLTDFIFRNKPELVELEIRSLLSTVGVMTDVRYTAGRVFVGEFNIVI